MNRFIRTFIVSLFVGLTSVTAIATEVPFSREQFEMAQSAGKPIAVVFRADWCPTCRAQAPVLRQLLRTPEMKNLTLYVANFDKEKALVKSLGIAGASTIVVFKGGREIARSAGDSDRPSLSKLLKQALI